MKILSFLRRSMPMVLAIGALLAGITRWEGSHGEILPPEVQMRHDDLVGKMFLCTSAVCLCFHCIAGMLERLAPPEVRERLSLEAERD